MNFYSILNMLSCPKAGCDCSGPAVPPWVGFNDEDTVQQQVLALSAVSIAAFKISK